MIKDNQQKFNRLHVVLDALVLIISYAAAFGLLILGNRVYSPHFQGFLQTIMLEFFHLNSI